MCVSVPVCLCICVSVDVCVGVWVCVGGVYVRAHVPLREPLRAILPSCKGKEVVFYRVYVALTDFLV